MMVHGVRRDAILDVAEHLDRTKGYERMSIQDVQDALGVSRGAIYHYFNSKAALLEAVVERMVDAIMAVLAPIAEDPQLPATAKLHGVFTAAGRWKAERRELMVALLEAWYSDHNAIVREHVRRAASLRLTPLIAAIVRQGTSEKSQPAAPPRPSTPRASSWPSWWSRAMRPASSSSIAWLAACHTRTWSARSLPTTRPWSASSASLKGSFHINDEPSLRIWFA